MFICIKSGMVQEYKETSIWALVSLLFTLVNKRRLSTIKGSGRNEYKYIQGSQSSNSLKDELKLLAQFTFMWESTEITFRLTALDLCDKGSGQHFYYKIAIFYWDFFFFV